MRKILLMMLTFISIVASASPKTQNDTIVVNQSEITRWIEEPYINSKGKEATHYYAIWKGFLLTTSKTTIEKVTLCKKYGAKCSLVCIGQRQSNGTFKPKRITTF